MSAAADNASPLRRHGDTPGSAWRRFGVIWQADARTARHNIWSTVLDISPAGARLRIDTTLLGQVDTFRLDVEALDPIECAPVWQQDGRLGVRFLGGQPSMSRLQSLVANPPYLSAPR
jgi:hypothetical protein